MGTGRAWWAHLVLLAAVAAGPALAGGCTKRSTEESKRVIDARLLPAGKFPSILKYWDQHNGHNPDALAFSPLGQDVDHPDGFRYYADGGNPGTGILLFTSEAVGDLDGGTDTDENLWASYHGCGTFTPPVEIFGENQDDGAHVSLDELQVLFLQSPNRRGDAIVLYQRRSQGRPTVDAEGDVLDEGNVRLYSSYFDVSLSSRKTDEGIDGSTMHYGFSSLATFVDADPGGDDDEADADVELMGFVSDGLEFSHAYEEDALRVCASGDDESFVYAVWTQKANPGTVDRRVWYSQFDLSGNSTRFPAPSTLTIDNNTLAGADGGTLTDGDIVENRLLVHNGLLIWEAGVGGDASRVLQASVFDPAGVTGPRAISRTDSDDSVVTFDHHAANLYGDDHGLDRFVYAFLESGYDDGAAGPLPDLVLATVDLDGLASEVAEMDEFPADLFEPPVRSGSLRTRISRTAEHVVVAWRQEHLPVESPDPEPGIPTLSGFARVVDVSELGLGIDTATSGDLTASRTAIRLNAEIRTAFGRWIAVTDLEFQAGLATGGSSPENTFQADPYRVHLLFRQEDKDTGGDDDEALDRAELHYVWLDIDPVAVDSSTGGSTTDTLVDTIDEDWSFRYLRPRNAFEGPGDGGGIDNGPEVPGTAVGCDSMDGFAVYWISQGNNKDDDEPDSPGTTIFPEPRLYFSLDGGSPVEISSDGSSFGSNTTSPDYYPVEDFRIVQTPCDDDVVRNPGWAAPYQHVFVVERHSSSGPKVLRHRVRDGDSTAIDPGDGFDPPLDLNALARSQTPPVRIDGGQPIDVGGFVTIGDGTIVEVYADVGRHVYWSRYDGRAWEAGDDPALVDHDTTVALTQDPFAVEGGGPSSLFGVFESRGRRDCPTVECAVVVWIKRDLEALDSAPFPPDSSGFEPDRLSVRVRE